MKGKDTDAGIRITVSPSVGVGRVVNRQNLQQTLTTTSHPVDHFLQVSKITYTETRLTAQ